MGTILRREASMRFKNKEREYLKDKINELATNKNIRDVYGGIRGSWDSVVGTATGYGLDDRGVGVRVPVWSFFFLHVVQTGL
jgi:hypothetical protein